MTVAILSGNGSGPFVSPMEDAIAYGATFSIVCLCSIFLFGQPQYQHRHHDHPQHGKWISHQLPGSVNKGSTSSQGKQANAFLDCN